MTHILTVDQITEIVNSPTGYIVGEHIYNQMELIPFQLPDGNPITASSSFELVNKLHEWWVFNQPNQVRSFYAPQMEYANKLVRAKLLADLRQYANELESTL